MLVAWESFAYFCCALIGVQIKRHVLNGFSDSGSLPATPAGTLMFIMLNFHAFIKCEVKHNGIWGWDIYFLDGWGNYGLIGCAIYYLKGWGIYGLIGCTIYDLNGWGIYGSNGWDSYGKVSYSFGRNAENTGLQRSTLSSHAGH